MVERKSPAIPFANVYRSLKKRLRKILFSPYELTSRNDELVMSLPGLIAFLWQELHRDWTKTYSVKREDKYAVGHDINYPDWSNRLTREYFAVEDYLLTTKIIIKQVLEWESSHHGAESKYYCMTNREIEELDVQWKREDPLRNKADVIARIERLASMKGADSRQIYLEINDLLQVLLSDAIGLLKYKRAFVSNTHDDEESVK